MSELQVETLKLGELDTNCYIAWCTGTKQAVIIDPADAGETITEQILALQLQPSAILLTHAHFDHVLGTLATQLSFDIPVYLHPEDTFLLERAQSSAEHWLKHSVDPVPPPTHQLHDGQVVSFGNCSLQVIHTPGHTPGSCSFFFSPTNGLPDTEQFKFSEIPILFSGDLIFKEGIGSTNHKYSNKNKLFKSLQKIKDLRSIRIYSGHGEPFMSDDNSLLKRYS